MKKKILIIISVLIILIIVGLIFIGSLNKQFEVYNNIETNNIYTELDKNEVQYQENTTVEDLKKQTSITGDDEIYEIQKEYDGRKVLTVKASIKYKVAFAGMIKNSAPKYDELDNVLKQNLPKYAGIWIEKGSRDKLLKLFNDSKFVNSKYYIDEDGYLKISSKNSQTDYDKSIEKVINGDKQFILDLSSVCYIVDEVTGEILDYNFENMDKYQTYEYFEDDEKCIVFINQNTNGQLSDSEIFESIVKVLAAI